MRAAHASSVCAVALLALLGTAQAQPSSSGDTPGATLGSLLDLARTRNPDYAAMRLDAQATGERELPAGALMNPRLKMELQDITRGGERAPTLLPSEAGTTVYTLSQDLPWAGKRALRQEAAALETEAAQGRAQQTWAELAARIKALYIERWRIQGTERLVNENLDLMLQLEKVLQVRYANGLAQQQDITRIHVEHTAMRAELLALAGEWRQSQTRLNALLGRPLQSELAAPATLPPLPAPDRLDFNRLSDTLRASSPLLRTESARARAAAKARDLGLKNRYPDVTLGVSAMQRQGSVNEWGLMLELNIPLQRDVLRAQEREAQALLDAAQTRQEAAANLAQADLADALSALQTARQTEHLMTYSLLPQAELTWQAALAAYENGKADFATLLDAQRQMRTARLGQLKAQVDARMRLADVERLIGEDL
jgi:cobalt-zinc-cadmium efflux system outer membrane protein